MTFKNDFVYSKIILFVFGFGLALLVVLGLAGVFPTSFISLFLGKTWTVDSPLNMVRILGGLFLVVAVFTFSKKGIINLNLLVSTVGLILLAYLFFHLTGDISDKVHFAVHFVLPALGIVAALVDKQRLKQ